MEPIALIKNGSHTAFREVYDEYHERIYFYILGKTSSQYMAEETVQLTFCKLWQYRETLNEALPIAAQLFRIANTSFINLLYKAANERKAFAEYGNRAGDALASDTTNQLDRKETELRIHEILDAMPPVRRKVFELSRVDGLSYREIASELSISIKTVEAHISKALQQLRGYSACLVLLVALFTRR